MNGPAARDYDYVTWNGRTRYVATPMDAPEPIVIDTTQVWLGTDCELRYWTSELAVTIYALRDAITSTGTRCAVAVRDYLERVGTR